MSRAVVQSLVACFIFAASMIDSCQNMSNLLFGKGDGSEHTAKIQAIYDGQEQELGRQTRKHENLIRG